MYRFKHHIIDTDLPPPGATRKPRWPTLTMTASRNTSWNDVIGPFMYLKQDMYPLTALSMIGYTAEGSRQVINQVSVAAGLMLAAPVIITFFLGQRYIVQGIVTTGIKG